MATASKSLSLNSAQGKVNSPELTLFLVIFAGIGSLGTGYLIGISDQPSALLWVALTLELTALTTGAALFLLRLGED